MSDARALKRAASRRSSARRLAVALVAIVAAALGAIAASSAAAPAATSASCVKFAAERSKGGSDANSGDEAHPYATLGKLASSLSAGQTGCIFSGQTIDTHEPQSLKDETHGIEGAPITITSTDPSEPATVTSSLALDQGSDWIDFTHLRFWWVQPPPYTCWNAEGNATGQACNGEPQNPEDNVQIAVSSSHTRWLYDDIQNFNTDICMNIVDYEGSQAHETLIEHDRIHNCGLPFKGEKPVDEEPAWHDHGIYDYGIGTKIINNYIYSNSRNGIVFYGHGSGGVAEHNIIDSNGNGITFGNTINSVARWNIITNNSLDDVGDCAPRGCFDFGVAQYEAAGDVLEDNCLDGNLSGEIEGALSEPATIPGVTVAGNRLQTDPLYEDAASHDYTLSPASPCLGYGPDDAQPAGGAIPADVQPPAVSWPAGGAPIVEQAVTALVGSWSGAPTEYSYQWNACAGDSCTAIAAATGETFTPSAQYAGDSLTVTVTATNGYGSASATSAQSPPIAGLAATTIGRPSGVLADGSVAFVSTGLFGALFVTGVGPEQTAWPSAPLGGGDWPTASEPSTAASGANIWIAFQGPGHSLWIATDWAGGAATWISYAGAEGTTYSPPSIAIDGAGNVWVSAEGPRNTLIVTERAAATRSWSSSTVAGAETVYSAPSVAADPTGAVWIAFQGPNHSLWVTGDQPGDGANARIVYDGPPAQAYSAPSLAVDSAGNVWVGVEGPNNTLLATERIAGSGAWNSSTLAGAETVYATPALASDSAGNVWIAFRGPGSSLWDAVERGDGSGARVVHEGPPGTTGSAPSEVIGQNGELWVGYQTLGDGLGLLERSSTGTWQGSLQAG